jgi:hypothetical protein
VRVGSGGVLAVNAKKTPLFVLVFTSHVRVNPCYRKSVEQSNEKKKLIKALKAEKQYYYFVEKKEWR